MPGEDTENQTVSETNASEGHSSKKLVILIGVLFTFLLIGGGIVAYIVLHNDDTSQSLPAETAKNDALTDIGALYPLDTFTVNVLSDDGREHYLKTQMNLELNTAEVNPEIDKKKAELRDIIIGILSSKSMEEVSTEVGKEHLKKEITDQINLRLAEAKIKNVYFTDFVEE